MVLSLALFLSFSLDVLLLFCGESRSLVVSRIFCVMRCFGVFFLPRCEGLCFREASVHACIVHHVRLYCCFL